MKRNQIIPTLRRVEALIAEYAREGTGDGHDFGFFAFCEIPEMVLEIERALAPWYVKLGWKIRAWYWRVSGGEDEIPF